MSKELPNIIRVDNKERVTTKLLKIKAPHCERDFYFIALSHLGRREYFERINRMFAKHPHATVIAEGRREENKRENATGNTAVFMDYITEQRKMLAVAANLLGIDLVEQSQVLKEP